MKGGRPFPSKVVVFLIAAKSHYGTHLRICGHLGHDNKNDIYPSKYWIHSFILKKNLSLSGFVKWFLYLDFCID